MQREAGYLRRIEEVMRWTCHWSRSAQFASQRQRQPQHNDGTSTMTTHIHQNKASSPQTSWLPSRRGRCASGDSWLVARRWRRWRRRRARRRRRRVDNAMTATPLPRRRRGPPPVAPAATAETVCLESRGVEAVAHSCVERESLSAAPSVKEAMAKTRAKERHLLLHRTEAVL